MLVENSLESLFRITLLGLEPSLDVARIGLADLR